MNSGGNQVSDDGQWQFVNGEWVPTQMQMAPQQVASQFQAAAVAQTYTQQTPQAVVVSSQGGAVGKVVMIIGIVIVALVLLSFVLSAVMYVWASSLAGENVESGSRNMYMADDLPSATTNGGYDDLIDVSWVIAEDDLHWAFVEIELVVGENTYYCTTGSDEGCIISQDGTDNSVWEANELLELSENGIDIVGESGAQINLYISYRGSSVSGDTYVYVS